jgi:hypothetical protein
MRDFLLFVHFIGLALGLGTSFAFLALGLATRNLPPAEKGPFFLKVGVLGRNGSIGLGLLLISGVSLFFLNGPASTLAAGGLWFKLKLGLIVILLGIVGYIDVLLAKSKRAGGGALMARIPKVSRFSLLTTILIVLTAVLAFH